jgi:hypothetical protein
MLNCKANVLLYVPIFLILGYFRIYYYYYYYYYSALGPVWQEPEPSQATGMALARCILGKFRSYRNQITFLSKIILIYCKRKISFIFLNTWHNQISNRTYNVCPSIAEGINCVFSNLGKVTVMIRVSVWRKNLSTFTKELLFIL